MKATQDRMEANTKAIQEWMERHIGSLLFDGDELKQEIRANREQMLAKMETNTKATQQRMDANLKDLKEDIKSGQVEVRAMVRAFHEKMDAYVASRRDD
jgi:argininosuccinate lyase